MICIFFGHRDVLPTAKERVRAAIEDVAQREANARHRAVTGGCRRQNAGGSVSEILPLENNAPFFERLLLTLSRGML